MMVVICDIYQLHFLLHFPTDVEIVFLVHFEGHDLSPVAARPRKHLCVSHSGIHGQLGQ